MTQRALLKCDLSRSAFSGERIFKVDLQNDEDAYEGVAPIGYCYDISGNQLPADKPEENQYTEGRVSTKVIKNGGIIATVLVPDGEIIEVSAELVVEFT